MRNRHLHPSSSKLQQWLDEGVPSIDEHVEGCLRCSERLEELTGEDSAALVRRALVAVTRPPDDLNPRLNESIALRMSARQDWALVGDLFGVSWRTIRVLGQGQGPHE